MPQLGTYALDGWVGVLESVLAPVARRAPMSEPSGSGLSEKRQSEREAQVVAERRAPERLAKAGQQEHAQDAHTSLLRSAGRRQR
jgi:hypothetical protein